MGAKDGRPLTTACLVRVRQIPASVKRVMFNNIEDEAATTHLSVRPTSLRRSAVSSLTPVGLRYGDQFGECRVQFASDLHNPTNTTRLTSMA